MKRVLVTGASGFLGRACVAGLAGAGYAVRGLSRSPRAIADSEVDAVEVAAFYATSPWFPQFDAALAGVDAVVHLAGRAHYPGDSNIEALWRDNVDLTRGLAQRAAANGVGRFVFVSSIAAAPPRAGASAGAPLSGYGRSKFAAEQAVHKIGADTGLPWVIVRPALVAGPGAPGNLARLCRAVQAGIPLPLRTVRNRRTLLGRDNFVDLVDRCLVSPAAPGGVWPAGDAQSLSTSEMVTEIAEGMGRSPRLLPMSPRLLRSATALLGRAEIGAQLTGDFIVDADDTARALDWSRAVATSDTLRATGAAWRAT
ncbi:hypothetical protein CKO28_15655 [Rhodovibrio sodomensis]|uniref:NAD-dependent epimerase/dehydratase domain-containing protein n=1 Tax=Rhodovibrio sodomensis TaxID=1088 RepID=A0ABS1DG78_9PROT|nr:NAD-dependent epimerase/dehydratase family protein [Rhodovibrio sodomensis]MBK1669474.1 hypothetical protein [Rhodovibrio sodomensis]